MQPVNQIASDVTQKHGKKQHVSGSGARGASSGGQVSACAGEERPSLFSDSGNRFPSFNSFAAALSSLGPAERLKLS